MVRGIRWPHWAGVALLAGVSFFCGMQWGSRLFARSGPDAAPLGALPGVALDAHGGAAQPMPLPGEFAPQAGMLLGCHELLAHTPGVFVDVVRALQGNLSVFALVCDEKRRRMGADLLKRSGLPDEAVHWLVLPLNSVWVRDYGPLFLRGGDGSVVVADCEYGWLVDKDHRGRPWDDDAPTLLAQLMGLPVERVPLYVQAGNLLSNGDGLLVSTHRLAWSNAMRGYDRRRVGQLLAHHLGGRQWVSLEPLLDEKTFHVDTFLTFVAPDVAVVGTYLASQNAADAVVMDDAAAHLAGLETSRGPMQVHRIALPTARRGMWRSYTHVLFANRLLLVPTFRDVEPAMNRSALALYARLLPGWRIVGIPCDGLAANGGSLHCISRNIPAFASVEALRRKARR